MKPKDNIFWNVIAGIVIGGVIVWFLYFSGHGFPDTPYQPVTVTETSAGN